MNSYTHIYIHATHKSSKFKNKNHTTEVNTQMKQKYAAVSLMLFTVGIKKRTKNLK